MLVITTISAESSGARKLFEVATALGIKVRICTPDTDSVDCVESIVQADALLVRIGPKTIAWYHSLLSILQDGAQKRTIEATLVAFNKCRSYEALAPHAIPMPKSLVVTELAEPPFLPGVLKVGNGNQGKGVSLITDLAEYRARVTEYLTLGDCLYQEYIAESKGNDKRLIVCSGKVVASMRRQANSDDFRANLHLGGSASDYTPTAQESAIAIRAVAALGLTYGGVDLIDGPSGPLLLEVNPSPGLQISEITQRNVAAEIIKTVTRIDND